MTIDLNVLVAVLIQHAHGHSTTCLHESSVMTPSKIFNYVCIYINIYALLEYTYISCDYTCSCYVRCEVKLS